MASQRDMFLLGRLRFNQANWAEAEVLLRYVARCQLLSDLDQRLATLDLLAHISELTGKVREALRLRAQAHELSPGNPNVILKLGVCQLMAGNWSGAVLSLKLRGASDRRLVQPGAKEWYKPAGGVEARIWFHAALGWHNLGLRDRAAANAARAVTLWEATPEGASPLKLFRAALEILVLCDGGSRPSEGQQFRVSRAASGMRYELVENQGAKPDLGDAMELPSQAALESWFEALLLEAAGVPSPAAGSQEPPTSQLNDLLGQHSGCRGEKLQVLVYVGMSSIQRWDGREARSGRLGGSESNAGQLAAALVRHGVRAVVAGHVQPGLIDGVEYVAEDQLETVDASTGQPLFDHIVISRMVLQFVAKHVLRAKVGTHLWVQVYIVVVDTRVRVAKPL